MPPASIQPGGVSRWSAVSPTPSARIIGGTSGLTATAVPGVTFTCSRVPVTFVAGSRTTFRPHALAMMDYRDSNNPVDYFTSW